MILSTLIIGEEVLFLSGVSNLFLSPTCKLGVRNIGIGRFWHCSIAAVTNDTKFSTPEISSPYLKFSFEIKNSFSIHINDEFVKTVLIT